MAAAPQGFKLDHPMLYILPAGRKRESIDWNMVYEKQNKECWMDNDRRFLWKRLRMKANEDAIVLYQGIAYNLRFSKILYSIANSLWGKKDLIHKYFVTDYLNFNVDSNESMSVGNDSNIEVNDE